MGDFNLIDSLLCNIGKTVTIFTESGGLSGSGFTGVLASVVDGNVRLITDIGAAPACPVGSSCTNGAPFGGYGFGYGTGYGYGYGAYGYGYGTSPYYGYGGYGGGCCGGWQANSWLGSVTEIPLNRIVSFVHVAI